MFERKPSRKLSLLAAVTAGLLAAMTFAVVALADVTVGAATTTQSITPTLANDDSSGNVPDCPNGTKGLKMSVGHAFEATETDDRGANASNVTVHIVPTTGTGGGTFFNFDATNGSIGRVYVKTKAGGAKITQFDYSPSATSDIALHGPVKDNAYTEIEHITFCPLASGVSGTATAVALRSFTATPSAGRVALNWRTASEASVLGYNLYGFVHGQRVKLNARVIASKGAGAHSYSFGYRLPQGKQAPARYWLQTINLNGSRQWSSARLTH
jgi:hypothetical protein